MTLVGGMAGTSGCGGSVDCTSVASTDGVDVVIARSLYVHSGSVSFRVCDAKGCATSLQRLGSLKDRIAQRSATAPFQDLGRRFDPGRATVTVALRGPGGRLVARRRATIEFQAEYPNGKQCDRTPFVGATLRLRPEDRVFPLF